MDMPDQVADPERNIDYDRDEDPTVRQEAGRAGWRLDSDDWYTRPRKPGDIEISVLDSHFGCMTDMHVFVRRAAYALIYDAGGIAPDPEGP